MKKILVIHKVRELRTLIARMLVSVSDLCNVESTGTADQALLYIADAKPPYDLIILQYGIGTEAEKLRIIQAAANAKILFISGDRGNKCEAIVKQSAHGFLPLPWESNRALIEMVSQLLNLEIP